MLCSTNWWSSQANQLKEHDMSIPIKANTHTRVPIAAHQKQDDALILSMAGKILAPIATRNPNMGNVVRAARGILTAVDLKINNLTAADLKINQPPHQDEIDYFGKLRNEIAEIAAIVFGEQLSISGSADIPSNPDSIKNAVKSTVDLALEVYIIY
jgi:hypothetical protein